MANQNKYHRLKFWTAVLVFLSSSFSLELFVSPQGNDSWPGTAVQPKASLQGARDAIRQLKNSGGLNETITVKIAGGQYTLTETVTFTTQDNGTEQFPIVYEALEGTGRPVFSGGRTITGFQQGTGGVWQAQAPGVADGEWYFEQLFINGRRALRAREPDADFFQMNGVNETDLGGGRFRQTVSVDAEVTQILAALSSSAFDNVNLMIYHKWDNTRRFMTDLNAGSNQIITEGRNMKSWNPWQTDTRFHLENFRDALDEPGEWFLDRNGTLSYLPLPGEDMTGAYVAAPVIDHFVRFEGNPGSGQFVQFITLKDLTFRHGQWLTPPGGFEAAQAASPIDAAVMIDGAHNVALINLEVSHVGRYGVWFRRGCYECRLEHSLIYDLGAGGVRIGESAQRSNSNERTNNITLDNNIIKSGGHIFPCAVGVWIGQSSDNSVTHNDIGDLYYSAVSVGWTWGYGSTLAARNIVSYNHMHDLGQGLLSDMGGVYTLGIQPGTVISNNVMHDVDSYSYGGWGLYTDEGSSNILMENNLVYNVKDGGFHQHYGENNTIRNNILAFSRQGQVAVTRSEDHLSFTFERNIVYFDQGTLLGYGGWNNGARVDLMDNIYWRADGQSFDFAGRSWEEWRAMGRDDGSVIADPMFMDPENYDFRFASDETIQQTGFVPFDYSLAGVYGDQWWKDLAAGKAYPAGMSRPGGPAPETGAEKGSFSIKNMRINKDGVLAHLTLSLLRPVDEVSVDVMDLQGRLFAKHRESPLSAGSHSITFHTGRLPMGMYVCRVSSGSQQKQRLFYR
jgi:parallel beta-helix repeat protein